MQPIGRAEDLFVATPGLLFAGLSVTLEGVDLNHDVVWRAKLWKERHLHVGKTIGRGY